MNRRFSTLIQYLPAGAVIIALAAIIWIAGSRIDPASVPLILKAATAAGVVGSLIVIAWMFDSWIDTRTDRDRYDGDTAIWVMIGCTIVICGWAIIMILLYGWARTMVPLLLLFACFAGAGIVMFFGEVQRTRNKRNDERRDR